MVVFMPDAIYVMELKLNGTAQDALDQINDKGYALRYTTDPRPVVKVGMGFSIEKRTLTEYKIIEDRPAAEVAHARQTPSKLGLPSLNRNFEDWPAAEVAHARQTPSKLGLPSLNRNFEDWPAAEVAHARQTPPTTFGDGYSSNLHTAWKVSLPSSQAGCAEGPLRSVVFTLLRTAGMTLNRAMPVSGRV